jgi:hypothetical protein
VWSSFFCLKSYKVLTVARGSLSDETQGALWTLALVG